MVEYETQVMRPADGRVASLPKPAQRLAHRVAQLSNSGQDIIALQIVISHGEWYLFTNGHREKLGQIDTR